MRLAVPATLLAASLALGGAIAYEAVAPLPPVAVETPRLPPRHAQGLPSAAFVAPPEDLYADIDAHPLFIATRKPLADLVQTNGSAAATSDFALVGVIMGGARAVALLRIKSTSATMSAAVGDMVNGWRVARIDATAVTLRAGGGEFVVPLDGPASQPPSAALPSLAPAAPPSTPPAPTAAVAPPVAPAPAIAVPARPAPPPSVAATAPKPASPGHKVDPTISPDALKGATFDPQTGEPTL